MEEKNIVFFFNLKYKMRKHNRKKLFMFCLIRDLFVIQILIFKVCSYCYFMHSSMCFQKFILSDYSHTRKF